MGFFDEFPDLVSGFALTLVVLHPGVFNGLPTFVFDLRIT